MGVPARFYEPFVTRVAASCGALVAEIVELPGQGTHPMRARRGADYGYREIVEEILPAAVETTAARRRGCRVAVLGHSLGGQLAVLASASLAARIDALVLIAAGTAHWRVWPQRSRVRAAVAVHAVAAAASLLPWYPGEKFGFGGNQSRRFMRDWMFNARSGRYRLEGSSRSPEALEEQLAAARLRLHALSIAGDPVAPIGAQEDLLRLLPNAVTTRTTVRGVEADAPWRRHFSWARRETDIEAAVARALMAETCSIDGVVGVRERPLRAAASEDVRRTAA
jgi:predicted alpha/beta hydrolase